MRSRPAAAGASLALALVALAGCDLLHRKSEGEQLWRDRCAECHGLDGAANTVKYMGNYKADLTDDTWEHGNDPGSWAVVIRDGVFPEMPANPDLTPHQVDALVHWIRVLRHEEAPPTPAPGG